MRAVPARTRLISGVTPSMENGRTVTGDRLAERLSEGVIERKHSWCEAIRRMDGVFLRCMEMFMNGAPIGMVLMRAMRQILPDRRRANIGSSVAVVGTIGPAIAARPIGTGMSPICTASALDSVRYVRKENRLGATAIRSARGRCHLKLWYNMRHGGFYTG